MSILLVEGDHDQASALERALHGSGQEIFRVCDSTRAVQFLKKERVELIVLDWRIPDANGLNLLHWIRANVGDEPVVLFLAARTLEADVAAALDAGADEYIGKPFREIELAARVNALLRRNGRNKKPDSRVEVGAYVLNPLARTIAVHGKIIDLTAKEFALANFLFTNIGSVLSRDSLSTLAWGRALDGTSRSLDTHIYRLRQKLALRPENGLQLSAVYTHGYRLDMVDDFSMAENFAAPGAVPQRAIAESPASALV
ncbi:MULTISPECIES: response regulator transcription factor [Burkholderia]|uniref:response regulator transcription factor n=1 Tax=Burkholderia TaxID=32008 RepID=UPI00075D7F6F|nr:MULTISPECIES: response regulator transcription factor [Burkholderia]KVX57961.1 two-component system response regulator [Burkholderia cepacia]KWD56622.1 two-component system response regulator [Burkholderia cepacia]KWD75062.1 two-component system response regulator [Burkholderia cepacia]MCR5897875.1 DNA-binding response regulator [Burkholderia sp. HAN2018]